MKERIVDGVVFLTPESDEEVRELRERVKKGEVSDKISFHDFREVGDQDTEK